MNNPCNYASNNCPSAVSTSRLGSCHHSHEKPLSGFLDNLCKDRPCRHPGHRRKNDHSSDRPHHWVNMPGLQLVTFLWNRWEDPNWSDALISHSVSNPSPKSRWRVWSNRQSSPSSWKSNSRCSRDSPGLRVFWVPRKWFEYKTCHTPSRR